MSIRKAVLNLNSRFQQRMNFLKKEYREALLELQAKCEHETRTKWCYEIDTYGEVASTADGVLIKYRECLDCGLVDKKVDNVNDYDSEIEFLTDI